MKTLLRRVSMFRLALPDSLPGMSLLGAPLKGFFNASFVPESVENGQPGSYLIAREAYYSLNRRGYAVGSAVKERTRNFLLNWRTGLETSVEPKHIPDLDGLEDIRITEFNSKLLFIAANPFVGPDHPSLHTVQVVGELDSINPGKVVKRLNITSNVERIEKNWVLYKSENELGIEVYPEFSMIIQRYGHLEEIAAARIPGPRKPSSWRGTKSLQFGRHSIFVDHKRIYLCRNREVISRYIFRFRVKVPGNTSWRKSRDFSIGTRHTLIYLNDIMLCKDTLYFSFSINDSSIQISTVPLQVALDLLKL